MAQLTHDQYEQLERAISKGERIAVQRRGTEYVLIPLSLSTRGGREFIDARNPTTGDAMSIALDELDWFELLRR